MAPITLTFHPNAANKGILRWISRSLGVPNINGEGLIKVTADDLEEGNGLTGPIGYWTSKENFYWASNSSQTEHWYQVDFKFFDVFIESYTIRMSQEHYHPLWTILASNDTKSELWTTAHQQELNEKPKNNYNTYKFDNPVKARYFRMSTNSKRFDNFWTLSIGYLEFFGKIKWYRGYTKCKCTRRSQIYFAFIVMLVNK